MLNVWIFLKNPKFLSCVRLKHMTVIVGLWHLMFLFFRIYEIAMDVYLLEDIVDVSQITYIALITVLQLAIVVSLFVGATKGNYLLLLPWLCFTAPIFLMATTYATLYIANGDCAQIFLNFTVVGLFWLAWYIVLKNHFYLRDNLKKTSFADYKYSNISDIAQPIII